MNKVEKCWAGLAIKFETMTFITWEKLILIIMLKLIIVMIENIMFLAIKKIINHYFFCENLPTKIMDCKLMNLLTL